MNDGSLLRFVFSGIEIIEIGLNSKSEYGADKTKYQIELRI